MAASGGCSLVAVHRLLLAAASLGAEHGLQDVQASVVAGEGLQKRDSVVVAHGLRCSEARGVFLGQGSNPRLLHWQMDLSTDPPGKFFLSFLFFLIEV